MKYTIELSGPTIAAYAQLSDSQVVSCGIEVRDACRSALTEHDLGPDGQPGPLTVGGKQISILPVSGPYRIKNDLTKSTPCDIDWLNATPAEFARLRKALGVEQRTCETCKHHDCPCAIVGIVCEHWEAKP